MRRKGIGYSLSETAKCQANGLVFVPYSGRCETPEIAARIVREAKRRGMGFLQPGNSDDGDYYYDDYFFDQFGNYWEYDWFNSGGGPTDYYSGLDYGYYTVGDTTYTFDPDTQQNFANPNSAPNVGATPNVNKLWEWLIDTFSIGTSENNSATAPAQELPGYCAKGTYHPIDDPFSCVPFPSDDATKKKQAATQRQGQQQQARQAKAKQQQANQTCPKDKQGRPIWRNPKTNQCELVPTCAAGSSFDQVTGRCLTAAQKNELYGNQTSWLWWIAGGVLFLILVSKRNGQDSKPMRRKR